MQGSKEISIQQTHTIRNEMQGSKEMSIQSVTEECNVR